ncbi:MAG TPA: ABC transporter substrate-binding protein [Trebonia sp.]|nr:ABC transporter substrate-binding protein [Trebonia sp.]
MNRLAYCVLAAAATATLAGCASDYVASAAAAGTPEQAAIVVDSVPAAEEGGLYVAAANGYFKQQGLNVQIKSIPGGEAGISDLQSGKAQLVGGNYVSFVLAQLAGQYGGKTADFRVVAPGAQMRAGSDALYVLPGSPIKTVANLAQNHASVGLNTRNDVGQVLLGSLLTDDGYSISDIRQVIPPAGFPALMTMLKRKQIDAAWLPQPFGTEAEQQYGAVELADFDQGAVQDFPFTGYISATSWVKSHPNTVTAFVRALDEGQQQADTDHIAVEKAMEDYTKLPAIVAATMPYDSYPLTMSAPQIQRVSNAMFEFGLEPGRKQPYSMAGMLQPTAGS